MVKKHDVVQVKTDHRWAGCFIYVTQVKSWGIQGFIKVPMEGEAHIRLGHDEYEIVGSAPIQVWEDEEDGE